MPTFEFICDKPMCQNVQEVIMNHLPDDVVVTCKVCGSTMKPVALAERAILKTQVEKG